MALKFYKCPQCGDIAIKLFDAGNPEAHCGGEAIELVANTTDAAVEKHVPAVTVEGNAVHVQVGEIAHPMLAEHYITFVCLETEKGFQVAQLAPEAAPVADFAVAEGDKPVRVYEYCNLHGLWVAEL